MNDDAVTVPTNEIQVDFSKPLRKSYKAIGEGVYVDPRTGNFYWRPYMDGRQSFSKLQATAPRFAKIEAGKLRAELALSKRGLAENPFAVRKTVSDLCQYYLDAGCPKKSRHAKREGKGLAEEIKHVEKLMEWPGSKRLAHDITLEHCDKYHAWRLPSITGRDPKDPNGRTGDRQVDKELVTLSNIYRFAMRNSSMTGIKVNPIAIERTPYRDKSKVKHCRDFSPANGNELHSLARALFAHHKSEVLGWQLLLEAMVGQRTHEILTMRWDAPGEMHPGFIKGKHLFLFRSKTSKGTYPYIEIHSALKQCLEAFKNWRVLRYPTRPSPWFFPSPDDPKKPVDNGSITHALKRITVAMGLPHRTSHGLRAYFVNVLRSQGKSDPDIALRIGQKSGGRLISEVYGEILPYKINWMPEDGEPAWHKWIPAKVAAPSQDELAL
ncbi:MAG: intC [Verrucomicrobiales bacterium]|nr:intC [Verrucomicrobiales bacterium]